MKPTHNEINEICTHFHALATKIMKKWQDGTEIGDMVSEITDDYSRILVARACETPKFSSKKLQEITIKEFADKTYNECHDLLYLYF